MPITKITLEAPGGRKDEVKSYDIDFDQNFDSNRGMPVGNPHLTRLSVRISRDSEPKEPFYLEWILASTKADSVDICFYDNHNLKKTIKIENTYLVSYNQECHDPGSVGENLVFSGGTLTVDDVTYDPQNY